MRAILVLVCFAALALAGCGSDDDSGGNGGTPGTGGNAGSVGSAGTGGSGNVSGGSDCERVCQSPCVGDLLTGDELEQCAEACEIVFGACVSETVAYLDCAERFDCADNLDCLDEAQAWALCLGAGF